jgi:hypothetical protein
LRPGDRVFRHLHGLDVRFAALVPNQGAAWRGAGQTLLYLLASWIAVGLIASGASPHWVLLASAMGSATVVLFTLLNLTSRLQYLV